MNYTDTGMLEHLKSSSHLKIGQVIKAGTKIADAGLTGKVYASGHLLHVCLTSKSNAQIEDFSRGDYNSYINCTIKDPTELVNDLDSKHDLIITFEYMQCDGVTYVKSVNEHLGIDVQYKDKGTAIILPYDIKICDVGSEANHTQFGNCVSFMRVESSTPSEPTTPSNSNSGFRLNRAETQNYPGNYDFDENQRANFDSNWDIKDGHSAVDRQGTLWIEETAFTFVTNLGTSSTSSVKELTYYYFNKWIKEPNAGYVPFKSNDSRLEKETDTARYGSGAYRFKSNTTNTSGWDIDTRFK